MKTIINILACILIYGGGMATGFMAARIYRNQIVKLVPVQAPIQSVREIQQRLKDLDNPRYDPGLIDGIPGPNTMTGWNNLIKDRYAKRAIEGR